MKNYRIKSLFMIMAVLFVILLLAGCGIKNLKIKKIGTDPKTQAENDIDKILEEDMDILDEITDVEEIEEIDESVAETADDGIPTKEAIEGELVSFPNLKATDPDGDKITYTFSKPLDASGKWQTQEGDAGKYRITITASDGKNKVNQDVLVIVNPGNIAPVITLASSTITVKEGDAVNIDVQITDPDGDEVKTSFTGWMTSTTKQTTYNDAGTHTLTIEATDGKKISSKEVTVIVTNVNRAPVIEEIMDIVVKEGDRITLTPSAADPDGNKLTYSFEEPFSMQGIWATKQGDAGKYRISATASDGELEDKTEFYVIVESLNKAPVITLASDTIEVEEGDTVVIDAGITDPEDDELAITYSGWMTSEVYKTTYDDEGLHKVTITASDGINTAQKTVKIVVTDKNRPPVFDPGAFK